MVPSGGCADASCACGAIVVDDNYASEFAGCSATTNCGTGNVAPCAIGLNPGGGLQDVDYTVTLQECLADAKLDLLLSQDLTGSFSDDLPNMRAIWPGMVTELHASYDARFGVSSYMAYGGTPTSYSSGDYPYMLHAALTKDDAATQAAIDAFSATGGHFPESQLAALYYAATDEAVGWGDGIKILLLASDEPYNTGNPSYPWTDDTTIASRSTYPDMELLKSVLAAANIVPIFAVTSACLSNYESLVAQLGIGDVVTLSSDSSNFLDVVHTAVTDACKMVALRATSDPEARVTVNPGEAFYGQNGAEYSFTATVDTNIVGSEYTATLAAVDGSTTTISVGAAAFANSNSKSNLDIEAAARADADGLELATCVVAVAHANATGAATEVWVPFGSHADLVKVLYKAHADEGVWTEVDASQWSQPHAFAGTLTGSGPAFSGYYAFLKTPGADDGSLAFSVRAGVVDGAHPTAAPSVSIAPTTPSPSPRARAASRCTSCGSRTTAATAGGRDVPNRRRRHGRRRGERASTTARRNRSGSACPTEGTSSSSRRARTTTARRSAPTAAPTIAPCADSWVSLVGIPSRSMSFPTALYTELFTAAELSGLLDEWAVGETWSSRCVSRRTAPPTSASASAAAAASSSSPLRRARRARTRAPSTKSRSRRARSRGAPARRRPSRARAL